MGGDNQVLMKGVEILTPLMNKFGFKFTIINKDANSGDKLIKGIWHKENRKIELSIGDSLESVKYWLNDESIEHEFFLWAVSGKRKVGRYSGNDDNTPDEFTNLHDDIKEYCISFLSGNEKEYERNFIRAKELSKYWKSVNPKR